MTPADALFDVTFQPARMSVRQLEEGLLDQFQRLCGNEQRRARLRRFHAQVRAFDRARVA
jgi:hypothetical protein